MWLDNEYQAAKALYFGIGRQADINAGLEALKGVFQRSQTASLPLFLFLCHSRESGNPSWVQLEGWILAFAGMTEESKNDREK